MQKNIFYTLARVLVWALGAEIFQASNGPPTFGSDEMVFSFLLAPS
jgi:hypothetical protein